MLVCVYGAGFPGDADLGGHRPYWAGQPCSECPTDRFPLCLNATSPDSPPPPVDLIFGGEPVTHTQLPNLCCKGIVRYNLRTLDGCCVLL